MIRMIRPFNETKILGVEIDGKTQVDMVSKTLLDFFKKFYFPEEIVRHTSLSFS